MPYSMTGFATGTIQFREALLTLEVKSVNHKYREVHLNLPLNSLELEQFIRSEVDSRIARGKVYMSLRGNLNSSISRVRVNEEVLGHLVGLAAEVGRRFSLGPGPKVSDVLNFPGVLEEESDQDWLEELKPVLSKALCSLLDRFHQNRVEEGVKLAQKLTGYLEKMGKVHQEIGASREGARENSLSKFREKMKLYDLKELDEDRLHMEVAYLIEKSDIEEELVRLETHLEATKTLLQGDKECGKKLNFLAQELNREINTIGSKASDVEVTKKVIDFKDYLEKFKEQILNLA